MKISRGMLLCLFVLLGVGMVFPFQGAVAQSGRAASQATAELIVFRQAPFVLDGHTYVPIRELAGHLGIEVEWDQEKNLIILRDGQTAFTFERQADQPGWGVVTSLGGELYHRETIKETEELLWPYRLEDEHLFLPLRHVARFFNWDISWDSQHRQATLSLNRLNGEPTTLNFNVEEPNSRQLWPPPQRIAYLTFDDGPSQRVTPLILNILSQENIKATFFVVGQQINKHPEILQRIHAEGHSIGNHTYSHQPGVLFSGVGPFMQEVRQAEEIIHAVIGERPKIVRMPYGTNFPEWPVYRRALENSGYRHISWNVNSFDANGRNIPAERIVAAVRQQVAGKDKVIILMHDLASITTAEALPEIIRYLKGQGYFIWPL